MHKLRSYILPAMFTGLFLIAGSALACGPEASKTHMGKLVNIDPAHKSFTIQDAQTNHPITFAANGEIINGLQGYAGSLMVNYEQTDNGLKAVGVTF